jgi:hypothetical protein
VEVVVLAIYLHANKVNNHGIVMYLLGSWPVVVAAEKMKRE